MSDKVYFYLFIVCAVLSQEIFGIIFETDVGESSTDHVREKRVISRDPVEDVPVANGAYPYVVNIKFLNKKIVGVGSILSPRTVITSFRAVSLHVSQYAVTSASIYAIRGVVHNVTNKHIHMRQPIRSNAGIALIYVDPPFEHRYAGSIALHAGPILEGMQGVVLGWSSSLYQGQQETRCPGRLRAITVPIIGHRECVNIYRGIFDVQEDNVCTYHVQKQCGHSDYGAPLVIDNELAGVHIGIISTAQFSETKPDIFVLLQHLNYNQWIRSHIIH